MIFFVNTHPIKLLLASTDARRTFSENTYFSQPGASVDEEDLESNPKQRALKNVLVAFTTHLGFYHPSFATLAAFFLLIVDDEHKAFWLLEQVVLYYYPENAFNGRDLSIDQSVLMQLVYDKMPGVWNKLSNKRCFWECSSKKGQMPPVTVVTSHWFLDGFINILPIEVSKDCQFHFNIFVTRILNLIPFVCISIRPSLEFGIVSSCKSSPFLHVLLFISACLYM